MLRTPGSVTSSTRGQQGQPGPKGDPGPPGSGTVAAARAASLGVLGYGPPVVGRGNSFGAQGATAAAHTSQVRVRFVKDGFGFRLLYANVNGLVAGDNPIRVTCEILTADGTRIPVFFGESKWVTLDPGAWKFSNLVGASYTAAGTYWVITYAEPTVVGGTVPVELRVRGATYGEGRTLNSNLVGAGSAAVTLTNSQVYSPVTVTGERDDVVSVVSFGNSIPRGQGDQTDEGATDDSRGFIARAFSATHGVLRLTRGGLAIASRVDPTRAYLHDWAWLANADYVIGMHENRDPLDNATGTAINEACEATFARMVDAGVGRIVWCTPLPDGDRTPAQVAASNEHANWLRTVPAPLWRVYDTEAAVTDVIGSNVWKAGFSADNTHPTPATHQLLADLFDPAEFVKP